MATLLFSLTLIIVALASGYLLQKAVERGRVSLPLDLAALRKLLQKIGILFFMPISFLGAVWIVSFADMRVAWLPVVGVAALFCGGLLGLLAAKMLKLPKPQYGVMFCSGSFTNIGAVGSLVCFMFLGEAGFALVALYKMLEEISYYTIGFPVARYFAGSAGAQGSFLQRIGQVLRDPFVATILIAFFLGLVLNLANIPRPQFMEYVTALFVPAGTFVLIFSIGLGMRFSRVSKHLDKCIAISCIKFICIPIIACSLAYLFDLHLVQDGLPFRVVAILSSMPVAFNALVAASIYDLDLDLANSLWLTTTVLLLPILPWLYFLVNGILV